jgi:tRNA-uridine 2-sulfurtransferase
MSQKTVVIAMSGGVDSSVAALLLKREGYHVIGMFMKNWEEKDANGQCQSAKEFEDVERVCDQIQIPCYSVNFVKEYWDNVFSRFLQELKQGYTPNPDILCNREIKFKVLLEKALEIGGDYLATGHYCKNIEQNGSMSLIKSHDPGKDQSYFLYAVAQKALKRVLFPVGHMYKSDLRKIAKEYSLATAEKKDSTGICFIGKRNFSEFMSHYISYKPGIIKTVEGDVVGEHAGLAYYTLGQRKGIGIGGEGEAWFVASKDLEQNIIYIAQGAEHPALFCDELTATEVHWISGTVPDFPFHCKSKIRYRQSDQDCIVTQLDSETLHVSFAVSQRAVTPRQSIVFYSGEECLGGAIIQHPGISRFSCHLWE